MSTELPVGLWTPADGPLRRYLSPSRRTGLAVGGGMVILAALLTVMGIVKRDNVDGWLVFVVLVVLVVFLGGLGLSAIMGSLRGGRGEVTIGPEGIASNRLTPSAWGWNEIDHVAVEVRLRRELFVTTLEPKVTRTDARIAILVQPAASTQRPPARIRVLPPTFTTGKNIPIVRDLDAALRAYAGPRYGGVREELTHTL